MANYGFIIDNRRCIGCHACTVACKSEHNVPVGVNRTWVKYIEKGEFPNSRRLFSVMRCNHCDNAPCVEICPVTALYRRDDGIVDFDNRRCIGCKACMQACPYDALYIDPETSTAAKCNYCAHRVDVGLRPACVNVCPTQAIISGDLDDPASEIAQLKSRQQVSARKTEKGTIPTLFYIDGDADSLDPIAANPTAETMWGTQSSGVGHYANHSDHALDRLGQLLSLGETSDMLSADESHSIDRARHIVDSVAPGTRRAYDAPQKGILWGWQVSGYLWTKSVASGIMMVPLIAILLGLTNVSLTLELTAIVISMIFMGITGGLLIWDLDQPLRFLNVLLRPQWRSWLVRGAYIITAYVGLLMVYAILSWLEIGLAALPVVRSMLLLLAGMTAIYTAFLFAQAKGRDFWQSPILAMHMLNHALIAGGAVFTVLPIDRSDGWAGYLLTFLTVCILVNLLSTAFELVTTHPTESARRVAHSITHGNYRTLFWGGVILLGCLVPLALMMLLPQNVALPAAGLPSLIGVFISQHIWVRAPQQIPLS